MFTTTIDIDDVMSDGGERLGFIEHQDFLAEGNENFTGRLTLDEWQALALNYTSGTTGNPKCAVYSHSGAY
jgi:fatty-acyl-CoA synthase